MTFEERLSILKERLHTFRTVAMCLLVLAFSPWVQAEPQLLRVNQTEHPLDGYAVGALKVALAELPGQFKLVVGTEPITQTRAISDLESNNMDLMWLASNIEVEEQLRPIRFPLLKGLLGHRICIINPERQRKFSTVKTVDDLNSFYFGQGQGWPDVEILKSNGLNVITTSKYQNLFPMTEGGRFDGFPRGVMEPWTEIASRKELGLTVDTDITLIYHLPFYLFVRKDAQALANKIMEGLELALANGKYDEYFHSHPMVVDALERSKMKNRVAFYLKNPHLHPRTPLDRKDYWLDIKAL